MHAFAKFSKSLGHVLWNIVCNLWERPVQILADMVFKKARFWDVVGCHLFYPSNVNVLYTCLNVFDHVL